MIDDRAVEAAARAMEPRCFEIFDAGYAPLNWFEERAFLNAEKVVKRARKKARAALTAAAPFLTQIPDGWKLVPVEPTLEMQMEGATAIALRNSELDGPAKPHEQCVTPDDWMERGANIAGRMVSGAEASACFQAMLRSAPLPPPTEKNDG